RALLDEVGDRHPSLEDVDAGELAVLGHAPSSPPGVYASAAARRLERSAANTDADPARLLAGGDVTDRAGEHRSAIPGGAPVARARSAPAGRGTRTAQPLGHAQVDLPAVLLLDLHDA